MVLAVNFQRLLQGCPPVSRLLKKVFALGIVATFAVGALSGCTKHQSVANLKVGQCFNATDEILVEGRQSARVEVVPCSKTHNSEVVGIHSSEQLPKVPVLNGQNSSAGAPDSGTAAPTGSAGGTANQTVNPTVGTDATADVAPNSSSGSTPEKAPATASGSPGGQGSAKASPRGKEQRLADLATQLCAQDFTSYVGKEYRSSKWDLYPLTGLQGSDKESIVLVCVALTLPEQNTSVRQSRK